MGNPRILVVDDSQLNLALLISIFKELNYVVVPALTGQAMLDQMEIEAPDLILLDVNLPDIDGFELAKRVKQDPRTKSIPIIFISAQSGSSDKVKAFSSGASDYVTKPFNREEVLARIQTHLTITDLQRQLENRIIELERLYKEMKDMSLRDALTGLHNRRYLDEMAAKYRSQNRRYKTTFTVLMGDIDHFKKINDTFGHGVGDEVLKLTARILIQSIRDCDTVARYGGEEFVILLPETDLENSLTVAQRVRTSIASADWKSIHPEITGVTISLGAASASPSTDPNLDIIAMADSKLYEAKNSGRNKVCS